MTQAREAPPIDVPSTLAHRLRASLGTGVALTLVIVLPPILLRSAYRLPGFEAKPLTLGLVLASLLAQLLVASGAFYASLRRGHRPRTAFVAALVTITISNMLACAAAIALERRIPGTVLFEPGGPRTALYSVLSSVTDASCLLGVWVLAFLYPAMLSSERDRVEQIRALAREAELLRLRSSLEPHFLLNTLNAIAGLVTADPPRARRTIATLGELLSDLSREAPDAQRALDEELAFIRRYLALLETRHGPALRTQITVAEGADGVRVPQFVLQPLVENAVRHGALRAEGGGSVRVDARLEPGWLVCTVTDDGPGVSGPPRAGAQGLSLVRRRLTLFDPRATLEVSSNETGAGTTARVRLPSGPAR